MSVATLRRFGIRRFGIRQFAFAALALGGACRAQSGSELVTGKSVSASAGTNGGANGMTGTFQGPGSEGAGGAASCAKSVLEGTLEATNILFVIDRSGSMNCNPPPLQSSSACELNPTPKDPAKPTRWQIVAAALKKAVAQMPATTLVGISYFNSDGNCGVSQTPSVPLGPLSAAQLNVLGASIDGVVPKGATPIVGAVTLGYKHLHEELKLPGNTFLVLLTDGAETCAKNLEEKLVIETVPLALSVGVRTFVIGAPGSDPARAFLSRIAWAGGTPIDPQCKHGSNPATEGDCHFDMTDPSLDFATELNAALEKISGTALSCELELPSAGGEKIDYEKVNVTFATSMGNHLDFFQDTKACANANGWQYNADKSKIILCGVTCDLVKTDPTGTLTLEFGCATQVAL